MSTYIKDPSAVLDYVFDWKALTHERGSSDWLASGETITSRTVTVDAGITKDSDALTDSATSVTVWLSGGTAGNDYRVTCRITTSSSRTDERTITIQARDR